VSPAQGAAALGLGLVGAAAFPPVDLGPPVLVSVSLFLFLLRNQDTQTARNLGLVDGLSFALGTMYWMFAIFKLVAIPLVAIMAAYFGILATLVALTRGRPPLVRAALAAMFAVAIDWLRGDAWYLRFPWYTPAHALASVPAWIASARWIGTQPRRGASCTSSAPSRRQARSCSFWFVASTISASAPPRRPAPLEPFAANRYHLRRWTAKRTRPPARKPRASGRTRRGCSYWPGSFFGTAG
jgi:hypothetical protein